VSHPPHLPPGKLPAALLDRLLARLPSPPEVIVNPGRGRDVAILDCGAPEHYLVATADPITFATDAIGEYVLAVNINDIATSGGEPRWLLATVLLPAGHATAAMAEEVFEQLRQAAARYQVALVGGHTEVTAAVSQLVVCGQMFGTVPREQFLTAAGVQPGDEILLVGPVPVEGTALLAREAGERLRAAGFGAEAIGAAAGLLHAPGLCVLEYARLLRDSEAELHALHDPTEGGLATGLWELAVASGVELQVDLEKVAVLPSALKFCAALGLDWRGLIASGCLLAAVAPGGGEIVRAVAEAQGVPVAVLGTARAAGEPEVPGVPLFEQDEFTRV
jgi:hydrogenase expression/formation protein HypE